MSEQIDEEARALRRKIGETAALPDGAAAPCNAPFTDHTDCPDCHGTGTVPRGLALAQLEDEWWDLNK